MQKNEIEIIEAYQKGKMVMYYDPTHPARGWLPVRRPTWNFKKNIYKVVDDETKMMSHYQLAYWISMGYGQIKILDKISNTFMYPESLDCEAVPDGVYVRRFNTSMWVRPTLEVFNDSAL